MRLTQKKKAISISLLIVLILFVSSIGYCFSDEVDSKKNRDVGMYYLLFPSENSFQRSEIEMQNLSTPKISNQKRIDSAQVFKELAFFYTKKDMPELACKYIERYIKISLDVTFVNHSHFDQIRNSNDHQLLVDRYIKKFGWWAIFCFYVAFVGFFLSVVLNFRRSADRLANFLMSAFVLLHSCFMIHMGLYFMNYQYYLPHTLYLFTTFSLLYGPLIFFYFKRVTENYRFKPIDLLHVLPTVLLIVLLFPIYFLSAEEKLRMVISFDRPYLSQILFFKFMSLSIYGGFVIKMYFQSIRTNVYLSKVIYRWQRNVVIFCSIYVFSYAIYAVLNILHLGSGFLFNIQVASLATMVLYVSYSAFVQPSLFGKLKLIKNTKPENEINKYEKSGLTPSLSLEFRERLVYLLNKEKVYKQNDITLQKLSRLLDTTRHNTSQVINEHFGLNFFELMNKYRIEEAKALLKEEKSKNFNIIDVAYEVGFNNKVTFNKSFKKYNQITPSEYLKQITI